MWGCGLSRSEWEERKLAFGADLLNGWVDSTSLPRRARHSLVLGSDDTLPRRSGVSAMSLGFVIRWMKFFWNENLGDLVSWGLGGAY